MSSYANEEKAARQDSGKEVRQLFDRYFTKQINITSNEVDTVVGFFTKRKFTKDAAIAVSTVIIQQAKAENKNVFQLIDTLTGLSEIQLSKLVSAILNNNRSKISALGYKNSYNIETTENRNVRL
jgi:Glu-tRNA(Gln) amidotransferase subunit E-like FAD-binding protein